MWASFATGLIGITVVLLFWVGVQTAWRRTFPSAFEDPDVLAGRRGCGTCERAPSCERAPGAGATGEEVDT